uniref:Uncharacterized protein n=1 Tax=Opuntia streptacantha TaxID=393608 RepID=A0A7C9ET11_OPUST
MIPCSLTLPWDILLIFCQNRGPRDILMGPEAEFPRKEPNVCASALADTLKISDTERPFSRSCPGTLGESWARKGSGVSPATGLVPTSASKSINGFSGLRLLESSQSLDSSHSLHTNFKACTTSPIKGR